jgi:hypothetical protein
MKSWQNSLKCLALVVGVVLFGTNPAAAQQSLPPDFAARGIVTLPPASAALKLIAPAFSASENVFVHASMVGVPDAQRVLLYLAPQRSFGAATLLEEWKLDAANPVRLPPRAVRIPTGVSTLLMLVQTPAGWLRTETTLHRGRKA